MSDYSSAKYADKDEMRASIDLLREQIRVSENGYLALFREHERDLVRLRLLVRALGMVTALLTGYVVADGL